MHRRQNTLLVTLDILEPSASDHRGASAGIVIGNEWGLPTWTGLFFHNGKGKLLLRMPLNQIFDDSLYACLWEIFCSAIKAVVFLAMPSCLPA